MGGGTGPGVGLGPADHAGAHRIKAATLPRTKIGQRIGRLDDATLLEVARRLALFLGFA
jgi:mRNA-degrading endonuclease toxin of MazEF toxin-antitoxin module